MNDDGMCVICLDNDAIMAALPCGHHHLCEDCAIFQENEVERDNEVEQKSKCAICREDVSSYVKIHLSAGRPLAEPMERSPLQRGAEPMSVEKKRVRKKKIREEQRMKDEERDKILAATMEKLNILEKRMQKMDTSPSKTVNAAEFYEISKRNGGPYPHIKRAAQAGEFAIIWTYGKNMCVIKIEKELRHDKFAVSPGWMCKIRNDFVETRCHAPCSNALLIQWAMY